MFHGVLYTCCDTSAQCVNSRCRPPPTRAPSAAPTRLPTSSPTAAPTISCPNNCGGHGCVLNDILSIESLPLSVSLVFSLFHFVYRFSFSTSTSLFASMRSHALSNSLCAVFVDLRRLYRFVAWNFCIVAFVLFFYSYQDATT